MSKHTPGPLYVHEVEPGEWVIEQRLNDEPENNIQVGLVIDHGEMSEEEYKANAVMFAAAPDMLKALKRLATGREAKPLSIARAAIAKAKGEA